MLKRTDVFSNISDAAKAAPSLGYKSYLQCKRPKGFRQAFYFNEGMKLSHVDSIYMKLIYNRHCLSRNFQLILKVYYLIPNFSARLAKAASLTANALRCFARFSAARALSSASSASLLALAALTTSSHLFML